MSLGVTPVDRVRLWEAQFRAMEREWSEISVRRTRVLMAAWRVAMSEMRRQHDRLVYVGLWVTGPSDFLAIIDQARAENTHSRMLRWPTRIPASVSTPLVSSAGRRSEAMRAWRPPVALLETLPDFSEVLR